jgi:hypothetical protein
LQLSRTNFILSKQVSILTRLYYDLKNIQEFFCSSCNLRIYLANFTYTFEEYDYYGGDDDAYGGDDDYVEPDPCSSDNTVYDLDIEDICSHNDFSNLQRIQEMNEYSKMPMIKECCSDHGYLFDDQCEVCTTSMCN